MAHKNAAARPSQIRLGLALPGGGVWGCFTAGVINALSDDIDFQKRLSSREIDIAIVTGTSAGAAQGAILTGHLNARTGLRGAVRGLTRFWNDVQSSGQMAHFCSQMAMTGGTHPNLSMTEQLTFQSILAFIPSGAIPEWIAKTTHRLVPDWHAVTRGPTSLQINAVRAPVRGAAEHAVFTGQNITPHAIAASTALTRFGGYQIGADRYYDGGYHANPHLQGLQDHNITDLIIMPLCAPPTTIKPVTQGLQTVFRRHAGDTKPMMDEVYHELALLRQQTPHMRQHIIALNPSPHWNDTSAMNNSRRFMDELWAGGYQTGQRWLYENLDHLGHAHTATHSVPLAPLPQTRYHRNDVVVPAYAAA